MAKHYKGYAQDRGQESLNKVVARHAAHSQGPSNEIEGKAQSDQESLEAEFPGINPEMYQQVGEGEYRTAHVSSEKDVRRAERAVRRQELHKDIDLGEINFDDIDHAGGVQNYGSASAAANLVNGGNANSGNTYSEPGSSAPGASSVRRVRHKKHKKKVRWKKRLFIVLGIVAAIVVAGVIAVNVALSMGKNSLQTTDGADLAGDNAVVYDEGERVEYNGHTYALNKNMVSIAFMGIDKNNLEGSETSPGQTDALMVVAVDSVTGKFNIIAIPRDTMVDIGIWVGDAFARTERHQICLAYGYGGGGTNSIKNTTDAISRVLLGIPMNYYYVLDMAGVGKMTDAVGGVTVTALESIPSAGITEGQQVTLTSENALTYVRTRDKNDDTSAMQRLSCQTQFIKAFASKALEKAKSGSVMDLVNLFNAASDCSTTNLTANEILYLGSKVLSSGSTAVNVETLKGTTGVEGAYMTFTPDATALKETILNTYYTQLD